MTMYVGKSSEWVKSADYYVYGESLDWVKIVLVSIYVGKSSDNIKKCWLLCTICKESLRVRKKSADYDVWDWVKIVLGSM